MQWNLASDPPQQQGGQGGGQQFGGRGGGGGGRQAAPGIYKVSLAVGGKEVGTQTVRVLEDVWLNK